MSPKPLVPVNAIDLFISSSTEDEAEHLRERMDMTITAFNEELFRAHTGLTVRPTYWRMVAAQKSPTDHLNDIFIELAVASMRTIVLLVRELGDGTREEIEAVLPTDAELSVLFYPPGGDANKASTELRDFLDAHSGELLYNNCGDPYGPDAWKHLVKVLLNEVLGRMAAQAAEAGYESR